MDSPGTKKKRKTYISLKDIKIIDYETKILYVFILLNFVCKIPLFEGNFLTADYKRTCFLFSLRISVIVAPIYKCFAAEIDLQSRDAAPEFCLYLRPYPTDCFYCSIVRTLQYCFLCKN